MRFSFLVFLLLFACSAIAQEEPACAEYSTRQGVRIKFSTEELYQKYGFQRFEVVVGSHQSVPYEVLAGKEAKVVGKAPGRYSFEHYHEVLVENCMRVYWYDTDDQLEPDDAIAAGIEFLDKPLTEWVVREDVDRLTDAHTCSVVAKGDLPFPMFHISKQGFSVGVVGGDFPGRPVRFRVDKNKAISETEGLTASRAATLLVQIKAGGRELLVGAYRWPHDYEVVREFNLQGLSEKIEECRRLIGK